MTANIEVRTCLHEKENVMQRNETCQLNYDISN